MTDSNASSRRNITRGVLLDLATIDRHDIDLSPLHCVCEHWAIHERFAPSETRRRICGAQLVVSNKVVLSRELLESAKGLKPVCVAATGTK